MTTKTRRPKAADAATNAIPAPERDLEKEIIALKIKIGKLEDNLRIELSNREFTERRARHLENKLFRAEEGIQAMSRIIVRHNEIDAYPDHPRITDDLPF